MKAQLIFDLPDDQQAFEDAHNGSQWRAIVQELDQNMRDMAKYGRSKQKAAFAEDVRQIINKFCQNRNLNIFD